jgi:ABC-2 type transport system permease protein
LASVFEYISVDYHFANIARGVVDTRDLIYYGSSVLFLLLLGTAVLQKRRWS